MSLAMKEQEGSGRSTCFSHARITGARLTLQGYGKSGNPKSW